LEPRQWKGRDWSVTGAFRWGELLQLPERVGYTSNDRTVERMQFSKKLAWRGHMSAGILFKCLEQNTNDMDNPNARRKKLYFTVISISIASTLYRTLCHIEVIRRSRN